MSAHTLLEPLANFAVNQLFNWAPFKRTIERPKVTPMPNGAETIEMTFDRGVEIRIVAVAKIEMKKAYVITASRDMAAGHTFKLQTEKRLVPIDLFLGWGLMSSPLSSRMLDYEKVYDADGGRTLIYKSDDHKVDMAWGKCAHVHFMNPAGNRMPKPGDCLEFEGYLVDVYNNGDCTWATDTEMGDEYCETVYPTKFNILR